jgi:membrane protease YdiL (CAAX protease family)
MAVRIMVDISYWHVLAYTSAGISLYLLKKNGRPSGKHMAWSAVFAALGTVAYLGYMRTPVILIYGTLTAGIPSFISAMAVFSVAEKHSGCRMISKEGKHPLLKSLIIAVAAGTVLSVINTFLALRAHEEIGFEFSLWKILLCFNPGIVEEIVYRAVFMAYCIYFTKGEKMSICQSFTMYFMMSMPHTVAHGFGLYSTIRLCLLFGIPFALLQRKRDITSAMVSHGLVDAVRFTLTGI